MVCAMMIPEAQAMARAMTNATRVMALNSRSAITKTTSGTTATAMNATVKRVRTFQWLMRLIVRPAPCGLVSAVERAP